MSKMASCGRQFAPHTANFECQGKKCLHIFIKSDSYMVVGGKMLQMLNGNDLCEATFLFDKILNDWF